MVMEQVRHWLRAGIVIALWCQKYERVYHMSCHVFADIKLSVGYLNDASLMQKNLDTWPSKYSMAKEMRPPSALEMQRYFQGLTFLEKCMLKELM